MFFSLLQKELKLIFKSSIYYFFVVIVILFYITQYGEIEPVNSGKPLQPLSEMQFMYTKLLEDYNDRTLTNYLLKNKYAIIVTNPEVSEDIRKRYRKANDYSLGRKERQAVRDAIEKMNPGGMDNSRNILEVRFAVSYEEYLSILKDLDAALGGYTYYGDTEAKQSLLVYENSYGSIEETDPAASMKSTYLQMKISLMTESVKSVVAGMDYSRPIDGKQKGLIEEAMKKILPGGNIEADNPQFNVTYEECLNIIKKLDKQLGVTAFEEILSSKTVSREMTYEEAMDNFQKLIGRDKLTNAYARCLADYMGITAGFLPVFLPVFILLRDYRSRMHELIHSRAVTSLVYVSSKFAAITLAVLLCYMGIAAHSTMVFSELAGIYGYDIDSFAFFKYTLAWVMPTAMFTTALGLLLSILFRSGIIAVAVQLGLWFASVSPLGGDYRLFKYIIRFNTVAGYEQYEGWFSAILTNRIFFILLSFGLISAAAAVFSRRRSTSFGSAADFVRKQLKKGPPQSSF